MKLFMLVIGARPKGRYTEQHDVFFGVAARLEELYPAIDQWWPEVVGIWHIDSWREVTHVDGYDVSVVAHRPDLFSKLYFINLGGYKPGDMEEYHYKMLVVAPDKGAAIAASKRTAFYKHTGFKGAVSHVDDKYGIDVDDVHELKDILYASSKMHLQLVAASSVVEDELHIGYLKPKRG